MECKNFQLLPLLEVILADKIRMDKANCFVRHIKQVSPVKTQQKRSNLKFTTFFCFLKHFFVICSWNSKKIIYFCVQNKNKLCRLKNKNKYAMKRPRQ